MQMISKTKTRWMALFLAVASLAGAGLTSPASAIVLEHKWQAGQQVPYEVALNGVMNVDTPADAPLPIAGIPLDIQLAGKGNVVLNTLSVSPAGSGTVQVLLPKLTLKGTAFGMGASLNIADGKATFGLNGAPGRAMDVSAWTNPDTAVTISRTGKFEGVSKIASPLQHTALQSDDHAAKAAEAVQTLVRVLPQLWPGRDIQAGESWSIEPKIPLDTAGDAQTISLGTVTMKLIGEEVNAGRTLQRVTVNGTLALTEADAQTLNALFADKAQGGKIISASKTISGDILFDATVGQVWKSAIKIKSTNQLLVPGRSKDNKPTTPWKLTQGFNGTVQLQLQ